MCAVCLEVSQRWTVAFGGVAATAGTGIIDDRFRPRAWPGFAKVKDGWPAAPAWRPPRQKVFRPAGAAKWAARQVESLVGSTCKRSRPPTGFRQQGGRRAPSSAETFGRPVRPLAWPASYSGDVRGGQGGVRRRGQGQVSMRSRLTAGEAAPSCARSIDRCRKRIPSRPPAIEVQKPRQRPGPPTPGRRIGLIAARPNPRRRAPVVGLG